MAVINAADDSIRLKANNAIQSEDFDIKLVSKHFIVTCEASENDESKYLIYYVNEVANLRDEFKHKVFNKRSKYQRIFISDHYSIDLTLVQFKSDNDRVVFISKIWFSSEENQLVEINLPFVQLDPSVSLIDFTNDKCDIALVNRRNLILMEKEIIKCYDLGESRRANTALSLKSGHRLNVMLSESDIVQMMCLAKKNKFIVMVNFTAIRIRKIYLVEIADDFQMRVKSSFDIRNCTNLNIQGNFIFYQTDYDTLVFYNALSETEMLRMKISVEIKSIQLSEDSKYLLMHYEDNTIRLYHFPNFKLLARLVQKDLSVSPILNNNYLIYHCNKQIVHVLKLESTANVKV